MLTKAKRRKGRYPRFSIFLSFMIHQLLCLSLVVQSCKCIYGSACDSTSRKNWNFAGSDSGGKRAAAIFSLIETAKLNGVNPQAWLTDALTHIADHPIIKSTNCCPGTLSQGHDAGHCRTVTVLQKTAGFRGILRMVPQLTRVSYTRSSF